MRNKLKKIAAFAVLFMLIALLSGGYTEAAQTTAMLKECLLSQTLYKDEYVDHLNSVFLNDAKDFKERYNQKAVSVIGTVMSGSFSGTGNELVLYGSAGSIVVDISAKELQGFKVSDYERIKVYGTIKMTGFLNNDSFKLVASHISVNPDALIREGQYSFFGKDALYGEQTSDIAADGHVSFFMPEGWNDIYCMGRLKNNGINGYQFFLNAIEPRNLDYPEIFNIFYFNYLEYVEPTPRNPSKSDRGKIEELIVRNILENLDADFKLKSSTIKTADREYDYISTSYALESGKTYNMEFLFLPDEKGLTCMLYIYYPKEGAASHLHEAAYLIETIEN